MPYPKYTNTQQQPRSHGIVSPWEGGVGGGTAMMNNPMALVNNLVGALMQQQNMVQQPQFGSGMMDRQRQRNEDYRRRRSRSPPRRRQRTRSRSRRGGQAGDTGRRSSPVKRKRSPPADRAEVEIYVGNYPASYKETQLRELFATFYIEVGKIRMKNMGPKVFAFAEATSNDVVQKAIESMDGKDIEGRRLRVRGSKGTSESEKRVKTGGGAAGSGRNGAAGSGRNGAAGSGRNDRNRDRGGKAKNKGSEAKKDKEKEKEKKKAWIPKVEDSKLYLVNAFMNFLKREEERTDVEDDVKVELASAHECLQSAFNLPQEEPLDVSRTIEDIFFRAVRMELKPPKSEDNNEANVADAQNVEKEKGEGDKEEGGEGDAEVEEGQGEDAEVVELDGDEEVIDGEGGAEEEVEEMEEENVEENEVEELDGNEENDMNNDDYNDDLKDLEDCLAQDDDTEEIAEVEPEPEPVKKTPARGKSNRGRRGGARK